MGLWLPAQLSNKYAQFIHPLPVYPLNILLYPRPFVCVVCCRLLPVQLVKPGAVGVHRVLWLPFSMCHNLLSHPQISTIVLSVKLVSLLP